MADHSLIEWTDATWNPITGCSVVSPGCTNCYAMRLAGTRLQHHPSRKGLTRDSKAGPVWNGQVRLNEDWLTQPLQWKQPRKIFVCAHGDLFAEGVPDAWIDRVFAVMVLAPQHTFQVLTKRAARMRAYLSSLRCDGGYRPYVCRPGWQAPDPRDLDRVLLLSKGQTWPLSNIWLGVSAEDQRRADERIPDLLATPAVVRFVSAEPLLGSLDLTNLPDPDAGAAEPWPHYVDALTGVVSDEANGPVPVHVPGTAPRLHWVIAGGESGLGARPMHPHWARSLRDQCAAAGVPFHFKQWGAWRFAPDLAHFKETLRVDWTRLPSEVSGVRPALMVREGKKAAGRLLDGVEHNGMPLTTS